MKDKIYKYIADKNTHITPGEILEQFFHTYDNYSPEMDVIVDSLLKNDARFVKDANGKWDIRSAEAEKTLAQEIFSIVGFESIEVNRRGTIPVLMGIAQVKDLKLLDKQLFQLETPYELTRDTWQKIKEIIADQTGDIFPNKLSSELSRRFNRSIFAYFSNQRDIERFKNFLVRKNGIEIEPTVLSLKRIAKKLYPEMKSKSLEQVTKDLGITYNSPLKLAERLDLMSDLLINSIRELLEREIDTQQKLKSFLEESHEWVTFSNYNFNRQYIMDLPESPGVYLMKNRQGRVFYVGKAKKLKSRVKFYFVNRSEMDQKQRTISENIFDLEFETVGSELEALLLEHCYIRKFKPDLNTQLEIHSKQFYSKQTNNMILFLPDRQKGYAKLFVVREMDAAVSYSAKLNTDELDAFFVLIQKILFEKIDNKDYYSPEQVLIIRRWLDLNSDNANFIDVDKCDNLKSCIRQCHFLLNDENLFTEKIYYQETRK